jgi:hypothetical protein
MALPPTSGWVLRCIALPGSFYDLPWCVRRDAEYLVPRPLRPDRRAARCRGWDRGESGVGRVDHLKTTRALGDNLRGRGHRAEVDTVTDEAINTLAPRVGVRRVLRSAQLKPGTTGGTGPPRPRNDRCRCRTGTGTSRGR